MENWDDYLTERDKEVFAQSGCGKRAGFGQRPAVLVIDMNSVFGGHGIQSGGVAVVGSPMQEALGFQDTPEQAYNDWMDWAVDGTPEWTRFYAENSREMIYDWVTGLGVRFGRVQLSHGNSAPRFHMTYRRGLNLTRPLFLEALRFSNITFK